MDSNDNVPFAVFSQRPSVSEMVSATSSPRVKKSPRKVTICAVASLIPDLTNRRERENLREFAGTYLKERHCSAYIPQKNGLCGCGRTETWHSENEVLPYPDPQTKWMPETNTRLVATTSFGEIEFPGFGSKTDPSPYTRVEHQTDPALLWSLLHLLWDLPAPKLVISVTGGAKRFFMKRRLKNAFKQGLIDVAATTDAWIITGGTAAGVMKYVGEAVQDYQLSSSSDTKQIVAIGIAAWGCVDNKESLIDDDNSGLFPAVYNLRDCNAGSAPLDHNHTHFILVDDGTANKYGTEISLRARLEEHIRTKCTVCLDPDPQRRNKQHQCVLTPVVLLVVEGGVNTLRQTCDAIKHRIPVVVIKGTGRVAEIICSAYKITKPKQANDEPSFPANFQQEMTLLLSRHLLPLAQPEEIPELVDAITEIMKHRYLVTIFELDDSTCYEMDKAVLSALLKAQKSNPQSQVDLALVWNRADIARQQIFTLENRKQWQAIALDEAMYDAMVQGREDFVQLFIDNGVHLGEFLTVRRLRDMYKMAIEHNSTTMSLLFKSIRNRMNLYGRFFSFGSAIDEEDQDACLLATIGQIISFLLNDKVHKLYAHHKFVVGSWESHNSRASSAASNRSRVKRIGKKSHDFPNPEKDLFLWALLFNRRRLARMFWKLCLDPIGGALVACRLLKSLAAEAESQEEVDLSCELQKEAQYYESLACGVMSTCYNLNKSMSHKLLTRELNIWGRTTLFSLAESAELMDFMQLSCCQTKLNRLWYGQMVDYTPDWKIILVLFSPWLVCLIRFKNQNMDFDSPTPLPDMKTPEAEVNGWNVAAASMKRRKMSVAYGICCRDSYTKTNSVSGYRAIYEFYTSPVSKFYATTIWYMVFLFLFTCVSLSELRPVREFTIQGIMEIIVWGWLFAFTLIEIREVISREARSMGFKMLNHMRSFWNQLDFLGFLLFTSSIILRLQNQIELDHIVKIIYALSLMFGYLRFMEFFYVSKMVGPKIIMIQKMLKDLFFFICILIVFILSFGIAMQALLYPNQKLSFRLLIDAVYTPYWQMFGELFIDRVEAKPDDHCTNNATILETNPELACPHKTKLVPILFAIYMLFTNVLLLNLLVAMFSYTFQTVQENSEKVWRFYRYSVIHHFYDAPSLPAPFVIINLITRMISFFLHKFRGTYKSTTGFKIVQSEEEDLRLSAFEKAGRERFLAETYRMSYEQMDSRVAESAKRIQVVMEDLEEIKEVLMSPNIQTDAVAVPSGASRASSAAVHLTEVANLSGVENRLQQQSELLHELIKVLTRPRND